MTPGHFVYEGDLLKHHIRTQEWLPTCRRRLRSIRAKTSRHQNLRRLKYFTFCAVGAIDVLMLDVARVIRQSSGGRFDTVVFFDRTSEDVDETLKRIPGAIGFPGDFIEVVLERGVYDGDPLNPSLAKDTAENRNRARRLNARQQFIKHFPFDVINLDLEEFLFKPTQPLPGEVVNAMRFLFQWQKQAFIPVGYRSPMQLSEFSLMFTTQIGPPNLTNDYLKMIEERIQYNLIENPELKEVLLGRTGYNKVCQIRKQAFEEFFKIGIPKVIASILMEEDWYIDPGLGVRIYEIERDSKQGVYKMLHLTMDVRRHHPPREHRAPGNPSSEAEEAYRQVAQMLFQDTVVEVTKEIVDEEALGKNLAKIIGRRKKYYPEGEGE